MNLENMNLFEVEQEYRKQKLIYEREYRAAKSFIEEYKNFNIFKRILLSRKVDQIMSIYLEEADKLEIIGNELVKRYKSFK